MYLCQEEADFAVWMNTNDWFRPSAIAAEVVLLAIIMFYAFIRKTA